MSSVGVLTVGTLSLPGPTAKDATSEVKIVADAPIPVKVVNIAPGLTVAVAVGAVVTCAPRSCFGVTECREVYERGLVSAGLLSSSVSSGTMSGSPLPHA